MIVSFFLLRTLATLLLQYRNRVHFQGVTSLDYSDVHFLVDTVFKIWQKEEDDKMLEQINLYNNTLNIY